jgi:hypothetical protein
MVAGFRDRPDLSMEQRTTIARLCRRYDPPSLSGQQKELLRALDDGASRIPSPLLSGFLSNTADLRDAGIAGFLDELTEEQRRLIADPVSHPLLAAGHYPLTTGELATLCGGSLRQVRYWADAGLIPSYRVDNERRFYSAAAVKAMVLAAADRHEVSALAAIARGGEQGERLLRLVGATIASIARQNPLLESLGAMETVGTELVLHAAQWQQIRSSSQGAGTQDQPQVEPHPVDAGSRSPRKTKHPRTGTGSSPLPSTK